jgi:hypothetical protein
MRVVSWIPVANLTMQRTPLGLSVFRVACHLARGRPVPPIHVVPVEHGRFSVSDGHVRVQAHKLLGRDYILARYAKEDRNEVK